MSASILSTVLVACFIIPDIELRKITGSPITPATVEIRLTEGSPIIPETVKIELTETTDSPQQILLL